jgi:hypothetical protein
MIHDCGNCPNNKTKEHSDEVKHGFVGKGSRYIDDDLIWCAIEGEYEGHWIEPVFSKERGCLSHPSAQAALRKEGAMQERKRALTCFNHWIWRPRKNH